MAVFFQSPYLSDRDMHNTRKCNRPLHKAQLRIHLWREYRNCVPNNNNNKNHFIFWDATELPLLFKSFLEVKDEGLQCEINSRIV